MQGLGYGSPLTSVMNATYADTIPAAHAIQAHFMESGAPRHSAYSRSWILRDHDGDVWTMTENPRNGLVIFFSLSRGLATAAEAYAAILQI